MINIFPSFYDYIVVPSNGFIAFFCENCKNYFIPKITCFNSSDTCCPYCGKINSIDHFYQLAYQEKMEEYYLISVKNLLALIDLDIEMSDFKKINEDKLQNALKLGYEKLNNLLNENKVNIQSKVYLKLEDIVNLSEYHLVKTKCCGNVLLVNKKFKMNYCIYCK